MSIVCILYILNYNILFITIARVLQKKQTYKTLNNKSVKYLSTYVYKLHTNVVL